MQVLSIKLQRDLPFRRSESPSDRCDRTMAFTEALAQGEDKHSTMLSKSAWQCQILMAPIYEP